MKKLLLFLLLMPMLAWGQFNPNQPYATVNNACGFSGFLQNGTYYSNAGAALAGLPTCTPPSGSSSSWSSLTAPTVNNSVTATADTQQALLGHFDTSQSTTLPILFSLGEDTASLYNPTSALSRATIFQTGTLANSLAYPIKVYGGGVLQFNINPSVKKAGANPAAGEIDLTGLSDAVTGSSGSSIVLTGGASASASGAGNIVLNGGTNSSSGSGGSINLNPGTSASGTSGIVQVAGALSVSLQTIDKSYVVSTPTTGQTVTLASGQKTAVINPAGTLATLTVTLPGCTAAYDGSEARFSSTQAITTLTVNATSGTVADAPTTLALGNGNAYICVGSATTWYRLN